MLQNAVPVLLLCPPDDDGRREAHGLERVTRPLPPRWDALYVAGDNDGSAAVQGIGKADRHPIATATRALKRDADPMSLAVSQPVRIKIS